LVKVHAEAVTSEASFNLLVVGQLGLTDLRLDKVIGEDLFQFLGILNPGLFDSIRNGPDGVVIRGEQSGVGHGIQS